MTTNDTTDQAPAAGAEHTAEGNEGYCYCGVWHCREMEINMAERLATRTLTPMGYRERRLVAQARAQAFDEAADLVKEHAVRQAVDWNTHTTSWLHNCEQAIRALSAAAPPAADEGR